MARELIDLEGKHIGFEYSNDEVVGSTLLKVYQVKDSELDKIWDPYDHAPSYQVGDHLNERAIKFLKKKNVDQIWTPGTGSIWERMEPLESFLDRSLSWYEDENNWANYKPIDDQYLGRMLKRAQIELYYLGKQYLPSHS
jgi:hypothetical protein